MYSVPLPVSAIRTRIRQEFERHRYVNKLPVVDVLLQKGNADYQVRGSGEMYYDRGFNTELALTTVSTGDDELLAPDNTHHVIFQGGELQGRQEATDEFHHGLPRGMFALHRRTIVENADLTPSRDAIRMGSQKPTHIYM